MPSYILPEELREELSKCPGEVKEYVMHPGGICIAVGDVVVKELVDNNTPPNIGVVDYKTRRGRIDWEYRGFDLLLRVRNPPGHITQDLISTIDVAFKSVERGWRVLVEVDGEEDLASIPAIIHAPIGATVIYGLPDTGVCYIEVNEEIKKKAEEVLAKMEKR